MSGAPRFDFETSESTPVLNQFALCFSPHAALTNFPSSRQTTENTPTSPTEAAERYPSTTWSMSGSIANFPSARIPPRSAPVPRAMKSTSTPAPVQDRARSPSSMLKTTPSWAIFRSQVARRHRPRPDGRFGLRRQLRLKHHLCHRPQITPRSRSGRRRRGASRPPRRSQRKSALSRKPCRQLHQRHRSRHTQGADGYRSLPRRQRYRHFARLLQGLRGLRW